MLLSAMQKGHFPFKKGTFSHHFRSWGGAHTLSAPPPFLRPCLYVYLYMYYRQNLCTTCKVYEPCY